MGISDGKDEEMKMAQKRIYYQDESKKGKSQMIKSNILIYF